MSLDHEAIYEAYKSEAKPVVRIFLLKPLSGITSQMVDIRQKMK